MICLSTDSEISPIPSKFFTDWSERAKFGLSGPHFRNAATYQISL